MQSQEGRKREKFENCLQIVGTSVPEGWNGLAIKSVSAMQTKNIAVRRRGRRGEEAEQGKLIICARGEIDDAQAAALCVVNGLCRAAGLPVEVADEQGGGVDHEAVAHYKANRSISVGVSRRYSFIPPIGLSVLLRFQAIKPFDLVPNLFS